MEGGPSPHQVRRRPAGQHAHRRFRPRYSCGASSWSSTSISPLWGPCSLPYSSSPRTTPRWGPTASRIPHIAYRPPWCSAAALVCCCDAVLVCCCAAVIVFGAALAVCSCYAILCSVLLCCAMLCCTMLCYATQLLSYSATAFSYFTLSGVLPGTRLCCMCRPHCICRGAVRRYR